MAKFAIPNLCGASIPFNKVSKKLDDIKSTISDNLEAEAATLASSLDTNLDKLEASLREMVPKLPDLPAINFQSEIKALAGLVPSSPEYLSKLNDIKNKFGSIIPDIDSLAKSGVDTVLAGGNICKSFPNCEFPDGATKAVEIATASLQATVAAVAETAQEFSTTALVSIDELIAMQKKAEDNQLTNLGNIDKRALRLAEEAIG